MSFPALPSWRSFSDLPFAYGGPPATGQIRETPEDFLVEEILGFEADGEGEHLLLRVRKRGLNTEWVARRLASHAGLPASAVSYAGLKDRHAVATQWFSVLVSNRDEPDWGSLGAEGIEVLESRRHRRKLRRGALRGNRFRICVRRLCGDRDALGETLELVRRRGVPNFFGAQRFGNGQGNLYAAHALFTGEAKRIRRYLRGLWLSAARSQLFNETLALRVERGDWDRPLPGDRMQLDGSRSHFLVEAVNEEILARVRAFDIHPSGPLWGAGEVLTDGEPARIEGAVEDGFLVWAAGLAAAGLRQERRPLRLHPLELDARIGADDQLEICFQLPAGGYATSVLRELVELSECG